jgi:hypothetical protein
MENCSPTTDRYDSEPNCLAQGWARIALLVALALSLSIPVYAHSTLGDLTGSSPYRTNDNELNPTNTFGASHVPGPLGYVWPGSGLDSYSGITSNPPGYQSPFTTFEQPTQEAANSYSPEGAILTSTPDHDSVGDLIFAVNFSQPEAFTAHKPTLNFTYSAIAIYIPAPVFDKTGTLVQDGFEPAGGINWDGGENTNIVSTITDNYANIFITRADRNDPFSPGSWLLYITAPNNITFTAARKWSEWYYIRINQMKAPEVAGRYFFKMFLDNHYPVRSQGATPTLINSTMPMENWPVVLVKGEADPAIVYGTVRYGDAASSTLYGSPLNLPGRVRAIGVASDPLTGESTGRGVEARGYFNATSEGHFEVEGVAPGIYDIYASAAGYPERKVAEGIQLLPGQSFRLDAYLLVGPQIRGEVSSKQLFGLTPWPGQRPITVVIYDSNTYDTDSIVTYSPTNLTQAPYTSYVVGNTVFSGGGELTTPNQPRLVAFPWEGPLGYYSFTPPPNFKDIYGLFNGVGPAQPWWVDPKSSLAPPMFLGSSATEFVFQFGQKSVYGAPAKFSGMVPQMFATWTDSLDVGRYYVRVFLNGYVQTNNDGTRFVDYSFQITGSGSAQNVDVPIDLWQSCGMNITVHFHDFPGTLQDAPIQGPDPGRFLIAEAFGSDGTFSAFNFTQVSSSSSEASIRLNGLGMAGPLLPPDPRASIKYSLARYRGLYDYGLPTDTYAIHVFMRGYIQALPPATTFDELDQPETTTVSISSCAALLSTHMYRGGSINTTIYSIDWERPPTPKNWVWHNAPVSVLVYDIASKAFVDAVYFWNSNLNQWMIPEQNSNFQSLPWSTWHTNFGAGASLITTNGSTTADRFGPDIPNFPSIDPSQDMASPVFLQENFHVGFLWSSTTYRTSAFRSNLAIYPGVYALNVWTYGYVQDDVAALGDLGDVDVSVGWLGAQADSNLRAIVGVNFTIRMLFKTEHIFAGIPYNASIRLRVYDEGDTLIAAASLFSDAGTLVPSSQAGFFADGMKLLHHPIPAGTQTLEYRNLAGLSDYVEAGGQNVRTATLFSPDHGVWGMSQHPGAYSGDWLVMVDIVNWYPSATTYYPPVPGLLQGESPYFYPYNHLGPYQQKPYTTIPNVAQGGEGSVEFELDRRGYLQGTVLGMNWATGVRTMSWATIQLTSGSTQYYWYTWDGWFDGYLDPGQYHAAVVEWTNRGEGHKTASYELTVNEGQSNAAMSFTLDESGIPIPELPAILPVLLLALVVSIAVLSSRRAERSAQRDSFG